MASLEPIILQARGCTAQTRSFTSQTRPLRIFFYSQIVILPLTPGDAKEKRKNPHLLQLPVTSGTLVSCKVRGGKTKGT
jgi:hypothetical protein